MLDDLDPAALVFQLAHIKYRLPLSLIYTPTGHNSRQHVGLRWEEPP